MADAKISQLPAAIFADLGDTDVYEVSIAAATSKKVTGALLKQFVLTSGALVVTGADAATIRSAPFAEAGDSAIHQTRLKLFRGAGVAGVRLFRYNGTAALPTTVLTGEVVGAFDFGGYDSAAFVVSAQMFVTARENWTAAARGSDLTFQSTLTGTLTSVALWTMRPAGATTSELVSSAVTARIVGGATNGLAIRNAANTRDNFVVSDAGDTAILSNGTTTARLQAAAASGEMTVAGARVGGGVGGLWMFSVTGIAAELIGATYFDGGQYRSAWQVPNTAGPSFSALALMRSGGNVVVGGTAAGATASGVLAFAGTSVEPTTTVDLVQCYGHDRSAGNRQFACFQEAAIAAGIAVASTHKWPLRLNGVDYFVLLSNV